jgi:hypothetical protein
MLLAIIRMMTRWSLLIVATVFLSFSAEASKTCLEVLPQLVGGGKFQLQLEPMGPIEIDDFSNPTPNGKAIIFPHTGVPNRGRIYLLADEKPAKSWKNFVILGTHMGGSVTSDHFHVSPDLNFLRPHPRWGDPLMDKAYVTNLETGESQPLTVPGAEGKDESYSHHQFALTPAKENPILFASFNTGKILKIDLNTGKILGETKHTPNLAGAESVYQAPALATNGKLLISHSTDRSHSMLFDAQTLNLITEIPHTDREAFNLEPNVKSIESSKDLYLFAKDKVIHLFNPENARNVKEDYEVPDHNVIQIFSADPSGGLIATHKNFGEITDTSISKDESKVLIFDRRNDDEELYLKFIDLSQPNEMKSFKLVDWSTPHDPKGINAFVASASHELNDGTWLIAVSQWEPMNKYKVEVSFERVGSEEFDDDDQGGGEDNEDEVSGVGSVAMEINQPDKSDPGAGELVLYHFDGQKLTKIHSEPQPYPAHSLTLNEFGQLLVGYATNVAKEIIPGKIPRAGTHVFSIKIKK